MRLPVVVVVLLATVNFAFGQQKDLISAPAPNLQPRLQAHQAFNFKQTARQNFRRSWYWEIDDTIRAPFDVYKYFPGRRMTTDTDFSPASLKWTFDGKRKLVPLLDLTVIQIKPGERAVLKPDAEFGSVRPDCGHLWDIATRSLVDMLRN